MYPFKQSTLEDRKGQFAEIRQLLNKYEFQEGGNWDYDHGYFDRKLQDNPGYLFIRIPVFVERGAFGEDGAKVRVGMPFLLRHKYQRGLDDHVETNVIANSAINQFSEPVDPDASIKQEDIKQGLEIIQRVEQEFQTFFD
jgi:hypothetical protein